MKKEFWSGVNTCFCSLSGTHSVDISVLFLFFILQSWTSESNRNREKLLVLVGKLGKEDRGGRIVAQVTTCFVNIVVYDITARGSETVFWLIIALYLASVIL